MLTLSRLSPHVLYMPADDPDRPALCAVTGSRGTLMLDAAASDAHARLFLDALRDEGIPAPRLVALTHWHWDHVFGAAEIGAPVIAQRQTAAQLRVMAGQSWDNTALAARVQSGEEIAFCEENILLELPEPREVRIAQADIVFDSHLSLDMGGVTCEIHLVGGDHAADACIMHIPEDGVLVLGDCLYDAIYAPVRHLTYAKLLPLLDRIESFGASVFVEGHGREPTFAEAMAELIAKMRAACAATADPATSSDDALTAYERVTGHTPDEDAREIIAALIAGHTFA